MNITTDHKLFFMNYSKQVMREVQNLISKITRHTVQYKKEQYKRYFLIIMYLGNI